MTTTKGFFFGGENRVIDIGQDLPRDLMRDRQKRGRKRDDFGTTPAISHAQVEEAASLFVVATTTMVDNLRSVMMQKTTTTKCAGVGV